MIWDPFPTHVAIVVIDKLPHVISVMFRCLLPLLFKFIYLSTQPHAHFFLLLLFCGLHKGVQCYVGPCNCYWFLGQKIICVTKMTHELTKRFIACLV
jgi:hypothetical protein